MAFAEEAVLKSPREPAAEDAAMASANEGEGDGDGMKRRGSESRMAEDRGMAEASILVDDDVLAGRPNEC